MTEKHNHESKPDKEDDRRDAVTSADATGMIAGEELITEAETILPISPKHK
jgi:hypothetical protein